MTNSVSNNSFQNKDIISHSTQKGTVKTTALRCLAALTLGAGITTAAYFISPIFAHFLVTTALAIKTSIVATAALFPYALPITALFLLLLCVAYAIKNLRSPKVQEKSIEITPPVDRATQTSPNRTPLTEQEFQDILTKFRTIPEKPEGEFQK